MDGATARGPVTFVKAATLVLGLVILIVGLHSHYQSSWVKKLNYAEDNYEILVEIRPYEICTFLNMIKITDVKFPKYPDISMERYFVAMILISFIMSILLFARGFFVDPQSDPLKHTEIGYHAVCAILLFIAGIVYIVSANQIHSLMKFFDSIPDTDPSYEEPNFNFRRSEKHAAASLAIIQSLLYGIVALLMAKG